MENILDYENEFKHKLGSWGEKLKPFIESEECFNIYKKIKEDAFLEKNGKFYRKEYIVPDSENTFRVFKETPIEKVKVVFYLLDPYPRRYSNKEYQATGIALDCSNSPDGKLQPSLTKFYDAISKDLGRKVEYSPDLTYLTKQGVMLLNTELTCKLNKTESHLGLWRPFQKFLLEQILYYNTGTIYVLCGKESHKLDKFILPLGNYIFKIEHPAAAEYSSRSWHHEEIFNKINNILRQNHGAGSEIIWDKQVYETTPPF